jgi:protein gp37
VGSSSTIEWTDATWNPVTGCTKVSQGCAHCYAEAFAERWRGTPGHHFEQGFDLVLRPERLRLPLQWAKPRRIFVTSMGDLFHSSVPDEFIRLVFSTMAQARQHTFQLLTKRPERMQKLLTKWAVVGMDQVLDGLGRVPGGLGVLPNVWLGTSVEDQATADVRVRQLIRTPAAIRFLSCEPLLGPVTLRRLHLPPPKRFQRTGPGPWEAYKHLDWVICGGESGHAARPMDPDWARALRDEVTGAGVAFFFKQWGGVRKALAGRDLDGRTWDEYPKGAA